MPLRDESTYRLGKEGEPIEVTEIRNKILDTFVGLEFVEDGHKYFKDGKELISVSAFVSRFEEEFDTVNKAINYTMKHGETPEYWMDKWKFNNLKATTTGTQVHAYSESLSWLNMGHPENIVPDQLYKYLPDKNWLIPTRPKEEAALKFWTELSPDLYVIMPETRVFSAIRPDYKLNFAGTFDLLLYYKHPKDDSKSGCIICDYKTNAELEKEYSRKFGKMLKAPFNDLYDEPQSAYTLQLGCYNVPLEDIGIKVIGRRLIWLKDDGNYETIKIPYAADRIRSYLLTNSK